MRYWSLIVLLSFKLSAPAQQRIIYDSSSIAVRTFSTEKINVYKKDPRFQYDKMGGVSDSWITRLLAWIIERWVSLFGKSVAGNVIGWVIIALSVLILLFFIIRVTGMTGAGLFGKKNKEEKLNYQVGTEDIHTLDFEEAIRQATGNQNFRLAVRLLYLQVLKKLTDRGLINWKVNKTNSTYIRELQGTAYQQPFGRLTLQFENNWYGDLPIDEKEFVQVKDQFNQFNHQLR